MKILARLILIAIISTLAFEQVAATDLDNKGKEFIMAFLPNYQTPIVELHLTGDVSTTVTIQHPVGTMARMWTFVFIRIVSRMK